MIGVDPDQDLETEGEFGTTNSIEGQMSQGDDFTAVCAEGTSSGISMCLTTDVATSYAFHQETFSTNVIATEQPIASATIPPKGSTNSADFGKKSHDDPGGRARRGRDVGQPGHVPRPGREGRHCGARERDMRITDGIVKTYIYHMY